MSVLLFETDKAGLEKFYEEIIVNFETYAPVEKFGKYDYKKVSKLDECDPDSPIETTMSIKPLFFPKSAKIMKFKEDSSGTTVSETDDDPLSGKRVILGVKHCDARGLQVLDQVYKWDYIDTDYQKRRLNTIIISTRCDKAGSQCFCTSLDYDVEYSDAHDIRIVNGLDGKIYIQAVTEKGEAFITSLGLNLSASSSSATEEMKKHYQSFESSFRLKMDYSEVNGKLQKLFDSPNLKQFHQIVLAVIHVLLYARHAIVLKSPMKRLKIPAFVIRVMIHVIMDILH